jgi:hypothetical protein
LTENSGADEQGITVGCRFCHEFGADDTAAARAVLDDERGAGLLGELLRE